MTRDRAAGVLAVDEFLDAVPEPAQSTLRALRATLRSILPDAGERLSYAIPAFTVNGTPVAGYAAAMRHCSYYPHSGSVLDSLGERIDGYRRTKSALHFPLDQPLPDELVRDLVQARLTLLP